MKGARPLSNDEIKLVLGLFDGRYKNRDKALFVLGLRTGFRISEILSLRVGDILSHGHIANQVTVRRCNMKRRIEGRTVVLHAEVKEATSAWLREMEELNCDSYLFRSRKGSNRPLTRQQAWAILDRVFNKARLTGQLGCHSLRKSFAASVHERLGRDILKTQRALGHKSISSTVSYLSFDENEITTAILSL